MDKKKEGEELTIQVCRHNFPKFPLDKTEFIRAFPTDFDEEKLKQAKLDYRKIKKLLHNYEMKTFCKILSKVRSDNLLRKDD